MFVQRALRAGLALVLMGGLTSFSSLSSRLLDRRACNRRESAPKRSMH